MAEVALEHRGSGSFVLTGPKVVVVVDPRPEGRGGAHIPERVDYVLQTRTHPEVQDAVLEVLEARPDATLVATPAQCARAQRELGVEDRTLDLQPWERARSEVIRFTALPTPIPTSQWGEGLPGSLPGDPLRLASELLRSLPFGGTMEAAAGMMGLATAQAYAVELIGGPVLAMLGETLAGRPPRRWLQDIADVVQPEVIVAAATGPLVEGVVWAARVLRPQQLVLYRARDPYDTNDLLPALPMRRFVEALEEDAPDLRVMPLRAGDRFTSAFEPGEAAPA